MLKQEVVDIVTKLMPEHGDRMLEIGTGWGESAEFFSKLRPHWMVYTIDGFGLYGDGRIYKQYEHYEMLAINQKLGPNVIQILGDSARVPWELEIDALFIDGDHSLEGCMSDFSRYAPWVEAGGIIIFDDYNQPNNPNNGVRETVNLVLAAYDRYELVFEGYYCAVLKVNYKPHRKK